MLADEAGRSLVGPPSRASDREVVEHFGVDGGQDFDRVVTLPDVANEAICS
jgi:hypothetical protein